MTDESTTAAATQDTTDAATQPVADADAQTTTQPKEDTAPPAKENQSANTKPKTYTEADHNELTGQLATAQARITALEAGVKPDCAADVIMLAQSLVAADVDITAAVGKVLEKYPHFKAAVSIPGAPNPAGSNSGTDDPFLKGFGK